MTQKGYQVTGISFEPGYVLQVGLTSPLASPLELVSILYLLYNCGYEREYAVASRIYDVSCATDHVMKFRPSPSIFAYCKQSKTGGIEGLGMRLAAPV